MRLLYGNYHGEQCRVLNDKDDAWQEQEHTQGQSYSDLARCYYDDVLPV